MLFFIRNYCDNNLFVVDDKQFNKAIQCTPSTANTIENTDMCLFLRDSITESSDSSIINLTRQLEGRVYKLSCWKVAISYGG